MVKKNCSADSLTRLAAAGIIGLALLSPAGGARAGAPPPHIKLLPVGDKAPLFEAVDIDGKPFVLEEELTRGPIMLVFWSIF